jgi:hypothetical protein
MAKDGAISTKSKAKPLALYVDSEEIITFLWCYDENTYTHPRMMIQLTFYILVASFWGLRTGEMVESDCYRKSNEGFKYKDVTLSLAPGTQGLEYQLCLALRNRKFKRDNENEV